MRKALQLLVAAAPLVAGWPTVVEDAQGNSLDERAIVYPEIPPPKFTTNRDNCGSHGNCTVFDPKDQFVTVKPGSGHEYKKPGKRDLRGQCPGLNAAANHAYLPRNGIVNTLQTIEGLGAAYSMSKDLAVILAAVSIGISGDPIAGTWSIGNGYKPSVGLLGRPTGIAGTHNRYEGDASIVKGDAYMHNGYVAAFEMHRWEKLYSMLGEDGLTHDKAAAQAYYTATYSIKNNPYYFSGPFSGLVAPDAHNFVVHFMSNRSAEHKGGRLHGNVLKDFFGVTGTPGNFKYHPGQERIPDNWYKRPSSQPMDTVDTNVDTVINDRMYPGIIRFGGNTGKKDSFVGLNLGNLTGGVFNGKNIVKGNNLSCFFYQATQAGLADAAYPLLQPIGKIRAALQKAVGPQLSALGCPQLGDFNNEVFNMYPGAS